MARLEPVSVTSFIVELIALDKTIAKALVALL